VRFRIIIAAMAIAVAAAPAAQTLRVTDIENRAVDPFEASADTKATVLLFVSAECPVSNRYAPVVQRLYDAFRSQGVRFWLVYPNPADSQSVIRAHLKDYGYSLTPLRDPQHRLVGLARATITPEAAVFDRARRLVYRGRIDDRYVKLGLERPAPTRHDLQEALAAVVAGKQAPQAEAPAVGCFIADFVH
jgi:hypothetical protein